MSDSSGSIFIFQECSYIGYDFFSFLVGLISSIFSRFDLPSIGSSDLIYLSINTNTRCSLSLAINSLLLSLLGHHFGHFYDRISTSYLSCFGQFPILNRHLSYIPVLLSLKDLVLILRGKIVIFSFVYSNIKLT